MTPQNFREFAEKRQKELAKLLRSDLPRLMGTKAMQHFRQNFAVDMASADPLRSRRAARAAAVAHQHPAQPDPVQGYSGARAHLQRSDICRYPQQRRQRHHHTHTAQYDSIKNRKGRSARLRPFLSFRLRFWNAMRHDSRSFIKSISSSTDMQPFSSWSIR